MSRIVSPTCSSSFRRGANVCASTNVPETNNNNKKKKLPTPQKRRDVLIGLSGASLLSHAPYSLSSIEQQQQQPLTDIGELGLGCWSWGNSFVWGYEESMDDELQRVFNLAVDRGVRLFDSADSYGKDGRSEQLLGKFIREYPGDDAKKNDIILATKFAPYPWRVTSSSFVNAAKESAKRFGKEKIDLGQLHWSTGNYQPLQEGALWSGIADAYEEGIIGAVGLSNYGPRQLQKIHKYMSLRGVKISTLQVQYHLLSRFPELNGTKETCDELGIKLIAYSPLALGLLTGKYSVENPPPGLRGQAYKGVLPPLPTLLEIMREVGDAHGGKSLPQVALNWCMCKDTVPIPGAKNVRQLEDNLGALGWRLSAAEVAELDKAAEKVGVSTSQNIFQTA
tara:strand:+ start:160 stop:1341 length:1182 start_codon:yes stop_codon:yes gene_type:complete